MEPHLVGRARELTAAGTFLRDRWERSERGAIEVVGEAGIGKSALVAAIAAEARAGGAVVLAAAPSEIESGLPWSTLAMLLAPLRSDLPASLAAAIGGSGSGSTQLEGVAFALAGFLAELASTSSLLVVLDDAMWLDPATATALTAPMRACDGVGWLVARRSEATIPFDLERLFPGETSRIELMGLATQDVGALALALDPRRRTRAEVEELHHVTGGNPLFVRELVTSAATPSSLPATLEGVFGERLRTLTTDELTVARLAALSAQPTLSLLRAALPDVSVEDAVGSLEAGRVLRVGGDDVAFVHELMRHAVRVDMGGVEALHLHRRLADTVTDPVQRAEHLSHVVFEHDEATAADLEAAARDLVRRGATARAGDLFVRAIGLTPMGHDTAMVTRKLAAADALCDAGDWARSDALYAELWEWVEAHPDHPDVGRLGLDVARGYIQSTGEAHGFPAGLAAGKRAATLLEHFPGAATHVYVMISRTQQFLDMPAGPELARRAVADAEQSGDRTLLQAAHAALTCSKLLCGEPLGDLPPPFLEPIEADTPLQFRSLMAETFHWEDRFDDARAMYRHLCDAARTLGRMGALRTCLDSWSEVEFRAGCWDAALALCDEVDELAGVLGQNLSGDDSTRIRVYGGRGDRAAIDRLTSLDPPPEQLPVFLLTPLHSCGFAEVALGRWERAHVHLTRMDEAAKGCGYADVRAFPYHVDLVETLVRLEDLTYACDVEQRLTDGARHCGSPDALVEAASARGMIAVARHDQDGADDAFAQALELTTAARRPLTRARALLEAGSHLRRRKARAIARAQLEAARALFVDIGAIAWLPRVDDEISRLGRSRQPSQLTPAERRVAELAASGMTNREIAASLVLSTRTVESTLSAVYRKLGTKSRPALAKLLDDRSFSG